MMNYLHLELNDIGIPGLITLRTRPELLSYDSQSRVDWNKIVLISSQIS